jgi:hypothetical protein
MPMTYTYPPFYDIEASVGDSSSNREFDVMLVQYFLFSIMVDPSWVIPFGPTAPRDADVNCWPRGRTQSAVRHSGSGRSNGRRSFRRRHMVGCRRRLYGRTP